MSLETIDMLISAANAFYYHLTDIDPILYQLESLQPTHDKRLSILDIVCKGICIDIPLGKDFAKLNLPFGFIFQINSLYSNDSSLEVIIPAIDILMLSWEVDSDELLSNTHAFQKLAREIGRFKTRISISHQLPKGYKSYSPQEQLDFLQYHDRRSGYRLRTYFQACGIPYQSFENPVSPFPLNNINIISKDEIFSNEILFELDNLPDFDLDDGVLLNGNVIHVSSLLNIYLATPYVLNSERKCHIQPAKLIDLTHVKKPSILKFPEQKGKNAEPTSSLLLQDKNGATTKIQFHDNSHILITTKSLDVFGTALKELEVCFILILTKFYKDKNTLI